MTQANLKCPKPHEVTAILGAEAVAAYCAGEVRAEKLGEIGEVRLFRFMSLPEMNAFIFGVDIAAGVDDALAVDDLKIDPTSWR